MLNIIIFIIILIFLNLSAYAATSVQTHPQASIDNSIVRMDGTSGQFIQNSLDIIDDNGNFGIGTTKPSTLFSLGISNSGGSITKNAFNIDSNGNITNIGGIVANINAATVDLSNSGGTVDFGNNANTPGGSVRLHSNAGSDGYISFAPTADTEKMRLDGNGNLGIGTTTPLYTLDVFGGIEVYGIHTINDTGGIISTAGIQFDPTGGGTLITLSTDRNVGIGSTSPAAALDITGNLVVQSGNIGIGTFYPGTLLDVQGKTRQTGFQLTGNGAASGFILQASGSLGIGTWVPAPGSIINSGTTNRHARYTGATTIDSSTLVFDDGTNIGIGTINPRTTVEIGVQVMNVVGTNIGIGSITPGTKLDINGTMRMIGTGAGSFRVQAAGNQACTTTCTTGRALFGFDDGTLGVALPHLVSPSDATADECLCGS